MACATRTVTFTGTVVSCETRFQTTVERAFVVDAHANWIVTIDVETADGDDFGFSGERVSFLFHSPTHLFRACAEDVAGWRCRFTIDRTVHPHSAHVDRIVWSALTARRIE